MKKAINLYFLNDVDTKEKLDNIKAAGFDGVLLGINNQRETMTLQEQIEYCNRIGLGISMIHCAYYEPDLNRMWDDNSSAGDRAEQYILSQLEEIKDFNIENFVIHLNGGKDVKETPYGLQRLGRIIEKCEQLNINLCIENLYSESQVDYIFSNINSQKLKFCYDSGHDNWLTRDSQLLNHHSQHIAVTHLHDNHGTTDEHAPLGHGDIDLDRLAKHLAPLNIEYLTAEVKYPNTTRKQEDILKENIEALEKLDEKIANYHTHM